MEWAFRIATDASFGGGHLARSNALATALAGAHAVFTDPGGEVLADAMDWARFGAGETDAGSAAKATDWLKAKPGRGLVIDSYALDYGAVAAACGHGFTAMFRDGPPFSPEHVSIDPNPDARRGERVLAGPEYFPLPPAFERRREEALRRVAPGDEPPRVLIAFGQRDSGDCTGIALAALQRSNRALCITVALGSNYAGRNKICRLAEEDTRVRVVDAPADLASRYDSFDLAVGAPGVSQFERACCGLPTLLVAQNERQEPLVKAWTRTGAAAAAPPDAEAIAAVLHRIMGDPEMLCSIREAALATVDGKGAQRLAGALTQLAASRVS